MVGMVGWVLVWYEGSKNINKIPSPLEFQRAQRSRYALDEIKSVSGSRRISRKWHLFGITGIMRVIGALFFFSFFFYYPAYRKSKARQSE